MTRILPPAVPGSLALILGSTFALEAAWCPPGLAILLLALGMSLGGSWGKTIALLAVGLVAGVLRSEPRLLPVPDRPVSLSVVVSGAWRAQEDGMRAPARGRWIRQGLQVAQWNRDLRLALPRGSDPPKARDLRVKGYLRRAVAPANGGPARPGAWVLRVKSEAFVISEQSTRGSLPSLWHAIGRTLRGPLEKRLDEYETRSGGLGAILVRVLVLGQADRLPGEVARGLRAAGLAHLVALSGLHIGLLAGSVLILTSWAPLRARFVAAIGMTLIYVMLAGLRPSLVRATLMMIGVMISWQLRRPAHLLNVLSWIAAAMVAVEPTLVGKLGFQLTVVATAGILLLAPRFEHRWDPLPKILRRSLSVSVAAHLAVLPWSLSVFHLATPLSPFWNLIAVPWAALTLTMAFLWMLSCVLAPPLALWIGCTLDILSTPVEIFGSLPPSVLGTVPVDFRWWTASAIAAALTVFFLASSWIRKAGAGAIALSLVLTGASRSTGPELVLLDVGQGEAILLRDRGQAWLIDGGGWRRADIAQRILLPALTRLGVRRLTGMILSHPDTDHCEGLLALSSYMSVSRLYLSPGWVEDACVSDLLARPGLEIRSLWRGEQLRLASWTLHTLHPGAGSRSGRNNRSLVLLAQARGARILLTGDLEARGEEAILAALESDELRGVDVLKVGHHGSDTSTSEKWLDRLRPRIALISCGVANRYGHPHARVVKRLTDRGVTTLRTDLLGAIHLSFGKGGRIHLRLPGQPRIGVP